MKLKINRYEFDVTNKDWVLDNGCSYQCVTLKHGELHYRVKYEYVPTIMSKKLFKELVKKNLLIDYTDKYFSKRPNSRFIGCKIWKFNIHEEEE